MNSWEGFLPENAVVMARKRPLAASTIAAPNRAGGQVPAANPSPTSRPQTTAPITSAPGTDSLAQIATDLQGCTRCKLCEKRTNIVIGEGNPHAELMFVGEGPGENEDLEGRPFVGKAGQLLDKMIEAMGLSREKVYIANVVKCRPPGNRNPELDEITSCSPFLHRQIAAIQPKIIVALGKFAAQTLLETETPITRLRGSFAKYRGVKLMPTFHPSYLLRNPSSKREAWSDLQLVAKELGIAIKKGN